MNNNTTRIPSLDGLRAFSIALVIFDHFSTGSGVPINTFIFGNFGVRIFFVISGFLITSILVKEFEADGAINIKKFYFRRTLRIFPAYYFYVFVILILTILGFYKIPILNFSIPLTYTSNYLSSGFRELGHTWSLSVEEQFYLILPGFLLIFGLIKSKKLLFLLLLVAPVLRFSNLYAIQAEIQSGIPDWFTFGFHTNMDTLAVGCLLALYNKTLHENKFYDRFLKSQTGILLLFGIIFLVTFNLANTYFFYSFGLTIINISIALCIDWSIENNQSKVGKLLNSKPLIFIGAMSYSLYLWQQPFSKYTEGLIWTYYPTNIILMILFSLFSYYVIEKKFLQWRQKWEKKIFTENQEKVELQTTTC
jgi:peptidoglycan/LPS O-acetylase OafA/YrhL